MPSPRGKKTPGTTGRNPLQDADPLESLLTKMEHMGVESLRALWKKRFRPKLPDVSSPDVLRRILAWRLQVEAHGGLDPEVNLRLRALMRTDGRRKSGNSEPLPLINLRSGTVLVRELRGVEHRVLVLGDGFEYRDRRFKSLTGVAQHIAGSRVSGPRFFGLEARQLKATIGSGVNP
jgi:hypothetical protein